MPAITGDLFPDIRACQLEGSPSGLREAREQLGSSPIGACERFVECPFDCDTVQGCISCLLSRLIDVRKHGPMLKPIGQFGEGGELCSPNVGPSSRAFLTSRSVISAAGRASVHPAGVPRWERTSPPSRSRLSRRRTTTGFVRMLLAMPSEVADLRRAGSGDRSSPACGPRSVSLLLALTRSHPAKRHEEPLICFAAPHREPGFARRG